MTGRMTRQGAFLKDVLKETNQNFAKAMQLKLML